MKIVLTRHAMDRVFKRKIMREEVLDALHFPDNVLKKNDKYYFQKRLRRGSIEVCCEKTERNINIITVYWV